MAISINTSMKCREKRASYLLLVTKLLYSLKVLLKKNYFLRSYSAALDVWTPGCFLRVTPEQADGVCEMEKHLEKQQPLLDSWYMCRGDFLIPNLGSVQKKKGRDPSLEKKCSLLYKENAWLSVHSSVHSESSWIAVFSALKITLNDPAPPRSSEWSCVWNSNVTSQINDVGLPRNNQMWVCSSLRNLWQVFSTIAF